MTAFGSLAPDQYHATAIGEAQAIEQAVKLRQLCLCLKHGSPPPAARP